MAAQQARGGVIEHRIGATGLFAIATNSGGIDLRGGGVGELDLVVEMPRSARLELATVSGDVHVAALRGQQRYKSVSGDLELEDVAGPIEGDATSRDASLQAAAPVALRLRTGSGDGAAKAP